MGKRFSKELELEVLEMYKEGIEIKEICRFFNVYKDYPSIVAKKYNCMRGSGKKSNILLDKFLLGTKESDYWIGWILTDGNLYHSISNRSYRISFATMDYEIVEKIKFYIPEINIHKRINGLYDLYFNNKEIYTYLYSLGITPNKSKTLDIKFKINNHTLRGIFDGDGSVHNKKACIKITTSSLLFGQTIVEYLKNNNIYSILRKRNTECYDIWIERKRDYLLFFNLIYKDSNPNILLKRKFDKFVAYIGNSIEKLGKNGEPCDGNTVLIN
jgi:hypothetical protein